MTRGGAHGERRKAGIAIRNVREVVTVSGRQAGRRSGDRLQIGEARQESCRDEVVNREGRKVTQMRKQKEKRKLERKR